MAGDEGQSPAEPDTSMPGPIGNINMSRVSSEGGLYVFAHIDLDEICCLVDSGSSLSVMHPSVYQNIDVSRRPPLRSHEGQIRVADGGLLEVYGRVELELLLGSDMNISVDFVLAEVEAPVVLGMDFLQQNTAVLDVAAKTLTLNGSKFECKAELEMPSVFKMTIPESVVIPPNTEMIMTSTLNGRPKFVT